MGEITCPKCEKGRWASWTTHGEAIEKYGQCPECYMEEKIRKDCKKSFFKSLKQKLWGQ